LFFLFFIGGERLDIFKIQKSQSDSIELVYQSTVLFNDWMGTINDVVPVSKGI
jgi:hypothetical protein